MYNSYGRIEENRVPILKFWVGLLKVTALNEGRRRSEKVVLVCGMRKWYTNFILILLGATAGRALQKGSMIGGLMLFCLQRSAVFTSAHSLGSSQRSRRARSCARSRSMTMRL